MHSFHHEQMVMLAILKEQQLQKGIINTILQAGEPNVSLSHTSCIPMHYIHNIHHNQANLSHYIITS